MFKYYNNSYFYVSFREQFLKDKSVSDLIQEVVMAELEKFKDQVNTTAIEIDKTYQTYAVLKLGSKDELRTAAELLSKRKEILACEFL